MTDKTTGLDPNVIDPRTRTIEALTLELDRVNALNLELVQAVKDAKGAISTINSSRHHKLIIDDAPVYWQTEEWVRWMLDEVKPELDNIVIKALEGAKK